MAVTAPVLDGVTLAHPNKYSCPLEFRGGASEKADGSLQFDLVQSSAKRKFTMEWPALTSTQAGSVETAWGGLDSGTASFTAPDGSTYTVTRDASGGGLDKEMFVIASGGIRWRMKISLREA